MFIRTLLLLLALVSIPALAQGKPSTTLSGQEFYETCVPPKDDVTLGFCLGFVRGTIEGMKGGVAQALVGSSEQKISASEINKFVDEFLDICLEGISPDQLRATFVKYLEDNQDNRHISARFLMWAALKAAFPCEER